MSLAEQRHNSPQNLPAAREGVTGRALILGVITIAVMTFYITHFGWNLIKNYMPVSALIPFVVWIGINTVLRLTFPRVALTRVEMLTIFFMVWLVGNLPTTGWAGYLLGNISAPFYLASPENRVSDVVGPFLTRGCFPIGTLWSSVGFCTDCLQILLYRGNPGCDRSSGGQRAACRS